ncbi:choice-of-anchor K domain-containing protein, partial [Calothrix rhizosoleniae]|uniref:choice-of-anchor K domain-containing protein n=1 Tax=Calothrix rhizosoleniae TaxID=888997 RepID=UPI00190ED072
KALNPKPQTPTVISLNTDDLLNITTSGIWTSVKKDGQGVVSGIGTNEISWGNPTINNKQSSYVFAGTDTSLGLDEDELLGTFTHNNFPITDYSITEANLALDLNIGGSSHLFNLSFKHEETPNDSSHPEDIVSIPSIYSTELFDINGEIYKLVVSGFHQNDHLTNEFITEENMANSAKIYGRLEKVDGKKECQNLLLV